MIEVKNLVKKYGNHMAIDHLNFKIEKGQVYGFLGPNGAGKSTTMNIMTGYLGATEGEVLIDGHDILKEPNEAKKHIGYLPEIPPLYVDMQVMEYLEFAAELKGIPKQQRESAIDEVIQMAKLEDVKLRLIRNLSKGYRELAKKHTVILSSHILAEIREVCDYILIISKGKLVASDTPDRLEEKMSGTETVEILAKASAAEVRAILLNVEHISNIHTQERADKTCSARIQTEGGCDIREALFFAFAKNECPLLELQTSRISLEEVFLELTQNDAVGEEERTNAGNL